MIDLGEFEANSKISSDNLIKNIAQNFKMHRQNLRHGVTSTSGTDKIPKTPTQAAKTIEILPAGAP